MSRRRLRRRERSQRLGSAHSRAAAAPAPVVREATRVERLAYTRTQAAEALGISRSTFNRRVLPLVETVETGWGTRLVPVDELERFLNERRHEARAQRMPPGRPGRKASLPAEVVVRIQEQRAKGKSLGKIAGELNADGVKTAQGGRQWWPSTVGAVLDRVNPLNSARVDSDSA